MIQNADASETELLRFTDPAGRVLRRATGEYLETLGSEIGASCGQKAPTLCGDYRRDLAEVFGNGDTTPRVEAAKLLEELTGHTGQVAIEL